MEIRLPLSPEILKAVAYVDHFRGLWNAGPGIPSERLERLREAARIQSIAASLRMAGLRVGEDQVAAVLRGEGPPVREEKEILGYARALDLPFPLTGPLVTTEEVRRLHAVAMGADPDHAVPTPWREEPYHLEVFDSQGRATGRVFQTLPPRLVPAKMEALTTWLELELREARHHPIPVIAVFLLHLVAACPFAQGNGRVAHLLANHLLRRVGYTYVPYASLEAILEEERQAYFEALDAAETHLWTGEADLEPWLQFFLAALQTQADRLREKIALEQRSMEFTPLQRKILETVKEHGTVGAGLLLEATGANRNTLKDNLRRLVERGVLERMGQRRGTRYRLASGAAMVEKGTAPRTSP